MCVLMLFGWVFYAKEILFCDDNHVASVFFKDNNNDDELKTLPEVASLSPAHRSVPFLAPL